MSIDPSALFSIRQSLADQVNAQIMQNAEENATNPSESSFKLAIRLVREAGSDYGDGVQTPLLSLSKAKKVRQARASGLDFHPFNGNTSNFFKNCILGRSDDVREELERMKRRGMSQQDLKRRLDKRETLLRLSPLMACVSGAMCFNGGEKHQKTVEILLENGSNPDAKDIAGFTALHLACGMLTKDVLIGMIDTLLKAGAQVNIRNRFGEVPLLEAVMTNKLQPIRKLLDAGADTTIEVYDCGEGPVVSAATLAVNNPESMEEIKKWRMDKARHIIQNRKCDSCGAGGARNRCSSCLLAFYCNRTCQAAHWRSEHKRECKLVTSKDVATVNPDGDVSDPSAQGYAILCPSQRSGSAVKPRKRPQRPMKGRFIVKVQIPVDNKANHAMVYDKERSFVLYCRKTADCYAKFIDAVKKDQFNQGIKSYFGAEWTPDSNGNLNIYTSKSIPYIIW